MSGKKLRMFTSETKTTPSETVDNGISEKTKKEDFDVVSFLGDINGIRRRYGNLYISLPVGTDTTFSFGADGQSIELKVKKTGYCWEDLVHSSYTLPDSMRAIKKDPYKLAFLDKVSPCRNFRNSST